MESAERSCGSSLSQGPITGLILRLVEFRDTLPLEAFQFTETNSVPQPGGTAESLDKLWLAPLMGFSDLLIA